MLMRPDDAETKVDHAAYLQTGDDDDAIIYTTHVHVHGIPSPCNVVYAM